MATAMPLIKWIWNTQWFIQYIFYDLLYMGVKEMADQYLAYLPNKIHWDSKNQLMIFNINFARFMQIVNTKE